MAKKDKFELDNFDFDSELDFNFDSTPNFGKVKDDRSPVISALNGVRQGATNEISSYNFIRRLVGKALPRGYGEALSLTEKTARNLKGLYDTTQREIKPMSEDLKRTVARAIPYAEEKLPKSVADKLKSWSKQESRSGTLSEEEMQNASIQMQLADIFKAQLTLDTKDKAKRDARDSIRDGIEFGRHTDLVKQLDSIRVGIQRLSSYQDTVGSAYQRKSLELQYRQFFVSTESLKHQKEFNEIFKLQLEGISKNTALPEYVKITQAENFQQLARNRFTQKVLDSMFNRHDSFFNRVTKNVQSSLRDKVDQFKDNFRSGLDQAEQMIDAREMLKSFKEMGMPVPDGFELGGTMVGASVADSLGARLGSKLGTKLKSKDKVIATGNRLEYISKYYPQLLERWANKPSGLGFGSGATNWAKDMILENNRPEYNLETDKVSDLYKPEPGGFSKRATKSMTEIIPGYLARILREVQVFRTGDTNIGLTHYDYEKNDFSSSAELTKSLKSKIFDKYGKETFNSRMGGLIDLVDPEHKLSPEERKHLTEFLIKSDFHDKESLTDDYNYTGKASKHGEKYAEVFKSYFGDDKLNARNLEFANKFSEVGKGIPDVRELLQTYVNLGYMPLLKDIGIVDERGNVDTNRMIQYYLSGDESIENLKTRAAFRLNKKSKKPTQSTVNTVYTNINQTSQASIQPTSSYTSSNSSEIIAAIKEASSKPTAIEILEVLKKVNERLEKGIPMYGYTAQMPEGTDTRAWMDMPVREWANKFKSKFASLYQTAKEKAVFGFDKAKEYGAQGLGLFKNKGKVYLDKAIDKVNEFRDVYVKGELSPRLILSKLREGKYAVLNPDGSVGKIIRSFKDITNDVIDSETGEVVLRLSEIKNAFVKNRMGGILLEKLGAIKEGALKVGKYLNLQFNNVYSMGFSLLKDTYTSLMNKLNEPQDVYVVGKSTPALLAITMRAGGYRSRLTGKIISSPKDIDGVVLNSQNEVVLTEEDIGKGLLNKSGTPLRIGFKRITGYLHDKAHQAYTVAKNALGVGKEKIKGALTGAKDFLQGKIGFNFDFINNRTNAILLQIRNMLNDRLSGDRTRFDDSFLSESDNSTTAAAKDFLAGFSSKLGSRITNLKNKLSGGGLIESIQGFMSGIFGKARGFGSKLKGLVSKLNPGSAATVAGIAGLGDVLSEIRDRLPKKPGMFSNMFGKKEGDGDSSLFGSLFGGGSLLGEGKGKTAETAGKAAGSTGLWGKLKGFGGKAMGKLGGIAKVLGTIALGTLSIGDVVAGAGALASGAVGLGGTLLAGAGTLAAGIASVISAPVVLGGLALAAAGAGAYYGYKYLTKKKLDGINKLRYAQYGFLPEDKDHLEAVFGLEDKLHDGVVYENGVARIDDAKLKVKDVISGFGVDQGNKDQLTNWVIWFSKRFKPIYLTHLTALNSIDAKLKLSDVPDLEYAKQKKYFDIAKWPNGPYNVNQSPFPNLAVLAAGDKEVATITKEVNDELLKNKKPNEVYGAIGTGAAATQVAAATATSGTPNPTSAPINPDITTPQVNTTNGVIKASFSTTALSFTGNIPLSRDRFASGKVSALDAIRFKAYGLAVMDITKLKAIASLEDYLDREVSYGKGGVAAWSGAVEDIFQMFGPQFGVENINSPGASDWMAWFSSRFMPVFLGYLTAVNRIAGKKNLAGGDTLSAKEEYDVALVVIGLKTNKSGTPVPIWRVVLSPWPGVSLNTDSMSVADNLKGLEDRLKATTLSTEVGKTASLSENKNTLGNSLKASKDAAENSTTKDTSVWDKAKTTVKNVVNNLASAASTGAGFIKEKASEIYQGAREIMGMGNGSGGVIDSVPMPKGEGSWAALKDTILAASKIVGVDDKLMATMAAIESGFRHSVKAGTSSATGLYQFITSTWNSMLKKYGAKYGIAPNTPPTEPRANALMGAEFIRENAEALRGSVKRKLTDTDLYIAHFMGSAGAKKFLNADPNSIAANLMPDAARANQSIFYSKDNRPLTVAEVYNVINGRVRNKGKQFGLDSGASDIAASGVQTPQNALQGTTTPTQGSGALMDVNAPVGASSAVPSAPPTKSNPGTSYPPTSVPSTPTTTAPSPASTAAQTKTRDDSSIYTMLQSSTDSLVDVNKKQLDVLKAILVAVQNSSSGAAPVKKILTDTSAPPTKAPEPIIGVSKPSYS